MQMSKHFSSSMMSLVLFYTPVKLSLRTVYISGPPDSLWQKSTMGLHPKVSLSFALQAKAQLHKNDIINKMYYII